MAERSKRYSLLIFLFALFIFLSLYIILWSYNIYTSTKNYTNATSQSSITCTTYSFNFVDNSMNYDNGTLTFNIDITNMISSAPKGFALVLATNETTYRSEPINIYVRNTKVVFKNVSIDDSFSVAPVGCEASNVKPCSLSAGTCR